MMKHKFQLTLILLFSCFIITAQQLTPRATVSIITCGPGSELYSTFGHSAFRVHDPILKIDKIYNYGTFDFNAPNFYLNFAKGNLIYQLSTTSFSRFLNNYHYENRWVKEQELNLNDSQVQAIYDFLELNAKPAYRSYRYDFFYDNCSTKIEEVVKTVLKDSVTFNNAHITSKKTHRDLIADYTKNHPWSKFGIDLALGSVIDDEASKDDYKFLPDYIYLAFENATLSSKTPLVKESRLVLKERKTPHKTTSYLIFQPLVVFWLFSLLLMYITYKNYISNKRSRWVDFILHFSTGLLGIIVLLLWLATAHTATYKNFNFLWAFAPNFIVAFYMLKKNLPKWIFSYYRILLLLVATMLLIWSVKIQVFNQALIPFILFLIVRYSYIIKQQKELSSSKK